MKFYRSTALGVANHFDDGLPVFDMLCSNLTALHVSVDGMLGSAAEFFVQKTGNILAAKWEGPYSVVMGYLSFVILTKWKNLGIVDGASWPIIAAD